MTEIFKTAERGLDEYLTIEAHGDRCIEIEIDSPWSGSTEEGFGARLLITLPFDEAMRMIDALVSWRETLRNPFAEPAAIRAYEARTGMITEPGAWVECNTWGCTPDAFVEDDGLLSIKCPRSTTIVRQRYFDTEMPPEYYWQAISEMVATGRRWCDLARYDDRFLRWHDQLWIERITYSAGDGARLVAEIAKFNAELDRIAPRRVRDFVGSEFDLPELGELA